MRHFRAAVALLSVALTTGCDYSPYQYDASGRLTFPDGRPAAGVQVMMDCDLPDLPPPTRPSDFEPRMPADYVRERSATTDESGRFHACFISGQMHCGCYFVFPPAPELSRVYIWIRRGAAWDPIPVRLDHSAQGPGYPGGRHLTLPVVTVTSE